MQRPFYFNITGAAEQIIIYKMPYKPAVALLTFKGISCVTGRYMPHASLLIIKSAWFPFWYVSETNTACKAVIKWYTIKYKNTGDRRQKSGVNMKKVVTVFYCPIPVWLFCILTIFFQRFAQAGFIFSDPQIPSGEKLTYRVTTDNGTSAIHETCVVKKDGDRGYYEITSSSPTLALVIRIVRDTMTVISIDQIKKFQEVTLASRIDVIGEKPNAAEDEVKLVHYAAFKYLMRGFPFQPGRKLKISYYGENPKKRFPMSITCHKRETLAIGNRRIECYRLEFGLDGLWSTFFSKSRLWYSAEPPHYLVKHDGPGGPPGAPEATVELTDRTVQP